MAERFEVDSWRFLPPRLARFLQARIEAEGVPASIPFAPLRLPLPAARVALLSTAGISCPPDPPFDMDGERANPTWGDPSWRRIAAGATEKDVEVNHLHIDTSYIQRDLDVALPLRRLAELVAAGEVGAVAPTHYAVMGYQPDATALLAESAPAIAAHMRSEEVDAAVLAPV
jgi:D-proline reductase (dithiol) PrdB